MPVRVCLCPLLRSVLSRKDLNGFIIQSRQRCRNSQGALNMSSVRRGPMILVQATAFAVVVVDLEGFVVFFVLLKSCAGLLLIWPALVSRPTPGRKSFFCGLFPSLLQLCCRTTHRVCQRGGLRSRLELPSQGWVSVAEFDGRLYLAGPAR